MPATLDKILVLAGVIPGDHNVGGIILGDVLDGFPGRQFACFSVCGKPGRPVPCPANAVVRTRPFANQRSQWPLARKDCLF